MSSTLSQDSENVMMMYPQRKLPRYQIETLKGYIIQTPHLSFHLHVVEKQPHLTQKLPRTPLQGLYDRL